MPNQNIVIFLILIYFKILPLKILHVILIKISYKITFQNEHFHNNWQQ